MQIDLANRAAIVTGGSKGLGFAIANRFAASGADVLIASRGREALDAAVKSISAGAKGRVMGAQGDVGKPDEVKRIYDEGMRAFGKIDIVVNNAGTSRNGAFETVTDEVWREDLEQKLFAAIRLTRLVWPQMKERRWGRVINVLNIGAKAPRAGSGPTTITRAAGTALTKLLSLSKPISMCSAPPRKESRWRTISHAAPRTFRCAASARRKSSPTWPASWLRIRRPTLPVPRSMSTAGIRRWCRSLRTFKRPDRSDSAPRTNQSSGRIAQPLCVRLPLAAIRAGRRSRLATGIR